MSRESAPSAILLREMKPCREMLTDRFAGAVSRAVRLGVHNVRVDPQLFGLLRRARGEQGRHGMSAGAQRDHRRL